MLEDSCGERNRGNPEMQIKESDSMQGESRLEKEADAGSSKTVPNHIRGAQSSKVLKCMCGTIKA